MRSHDWLSTSLGRPDTWPQPLRTALRLLLNTGHPMYIWWGPELLCFYNDAYRQSIGPERHPSSLGRPARAVWDEIWPIIGPQIQQVMAGQGATWHENQLVPIHRHGRLEQVYWTYSYGPIDDEAAAFGVGGVLVVCTETTQHVMAEQRSRNAEADWRALFDQAPSFMCILKGPDHRYEYANPRYHQLVGRSELIGRCVADVLPGVVEQGFAALLDRVFLTGEAYTAQAAPILLQRAETGDERAQLYLNFLYQPIRDSAGTITGIFVEGSDVTDRVLGSRALAESESRFRTLAEQIPILCWMADETGSIFWYNSRWYEYTGMSPEQMAGWGWQSVHDPNVLPGVLEHWHASIATGEPFEMVFPLRSATGQFRPFLTRIVPSRDADGRIERWFGTNVDIGQQLAAEDALRAADRRKDEFLATLAHELRNPLAPIRNAARILRAPATDAKTREWATTLIDRQIHTMAGLLDDLLDVSRITRGQLILNKQLTALSAIVDAGVEVARPLIEARRHNLKIVAPNEPIEIDADPLRLTQVLANLLTNAAKYTDAGGQIELQTWSDSSWACVAVKDSGIGLEADSLASVFEMFSQVRTDVDRSGGGLGIGLALVKGLVGLHGGRVEARSAGLGHGSEFRIWLPLPTLAHTGHELPDDSSRSDPIHSRRILVVDDNEDTANSLSILLQQLGHRVRVAHEGEQALSLAEEFRPEVALMDIGLPRLNGYELAQAIRCTAWGKTILLAALTGYGQEHDKRRAASAGFDIHLTKPVHPDEISRLISQHFETQFPQH